MTPLDILDPSSNTSSSTSKPQARSHSHPPNLTQTQSNKNLCASQAGKESSTWGKLHSYNSMVTRILPQPTLSPITTLQQLGFSLTNAFALYTPYPILICSTHEFLLSTHKFHDHSFPIPPPSDPDPPYFWITGRILKQKIYGRVYRWCVESQYRTPDNPSFV